MSPKACLNKVSISKLNKLTIEHKAKGLYIEPSTEINVGYMKGGDGYTYNMQTNKYYDDTAREIFSYMNPLLLSNVTWSGGWSILSLRVCLGFYIDIDCDKSISLSHLDRVSVKIQLNDLETKQKLIKLLNTAKFYNLLELFKKFFRKEIIEQCPHYLNIYMESPHYMNIYMEK